MPHILENRETCSSMSYTRHATAARSLDVGIEAMANHTGAGRMIRQHGRQLTHIVLTMSDDQGWGEMGYRGHKILRTKNLVDMASNGLRLERFYVSPICSPTRSSVLTGRAADRTGVSDQGQPLRLQERTLAQAFKKAGWATGHFGALSRWAKSCASRPRHV
jgi:hypothetical protein